MDARRAVVKVPEQMLHALLALPPGYTIVGVRDDWASNGIRVLVTSPDLDEVPPEVEPPLLAGSWDLLQRPAVSWVKLSP